MIFQDPITATESIPLDLRRENVFGLLVLKLITSVSASQSVVFRMRNQTMAINLNVANLCVPFLGRWEEGSRKGMGTTECMQVQQCLDQFGYDVNLLLLLPYYNGSTTVRNIWNRIA